MNIIKGIGAVLCTPFILMFGLLYLVVSKDEYNSNIKPDEPLTILDVCK